MKYLNFWNYWFYVGIISGFILSVLSILLLLLNFIYISINFNENEIQPIITPVVFYLKLKIYLYMIIFSLRFLE